MGFEVKGFKYYLILKRLIKLLKFRYFIVIGRVVLSRWKLSGVIFVYWYKVTRFFRNEVSWILV